MSGRPEVLYPLFADLTSLPGVGPRTARAFAGLNVEAPRDLLHVLPNAVIERHRVASVRDVVPPANVTVEVEVLRHQPPGRRGRPHLVTVRDAGTTFQLVYFHAADDWLRRLFPVGARRIVSGRVEHYDNLARIVHPDHVAEPREAGEIRGWSPSIPWRRA